MERVLRRVGLSKRPQQAEGVEPRRRRRRRSQSRRRPAAAAAAAAPDAKPPSRGGLFRIDWEAVRDCRSCRSRAITRRLCSRRTDNELYRSNSFKFERFIRGNDDASTLGKQISLCEDYSLPVDHLAKRRPNSIAVPNSNFIANHFSEWNVVSSPNEDKVEVLDNYSTPRDSQQQLAQEDCDAKCFTSPDKEYSQPYTTDESSNPSSDAEFHQVSAPLRHKPLDLNSPDSINEGANAPSVLDVLSPNRFDSASKRHPSPYYYGDLFKYRREENSPPASKSQEVKNGKEREKGNKKKERQIQAKDSKANRKNRRTSLGNVNEAKGKSSKAKQSKTQLRYRSSSLESRTSEDSKDADTQHRSQTNSMQQNIINVIQVPNFEDGIDEMTRQRHVYETAFDCQVSKSDDDLDQIEKVTNHPVLVQVNSTWDCQRGSDPSAVAGNKLHLRGKLKETEEKPNQSQEDNNTVITLSQDLKNMHLVTEDTSSSGALPIRGYTPSPPSTAPLPAKFPGKELLMNSIRSAPNLPSKSKHKDLHLPVKSLRGRSPNTSSGSLHIHERSAFDIEFGENSQSGQRFTDKRIAEFKGRPKMDKDRIYEIKGRPKRDLLMIPKRAKDSMVRRMRHKYSSTESMTTSSSGGSMESIKSSTSEGNRSTSSSESRQSASLSSHSSDSGGKCNRPATYSGPPSNFLTQTATNKLHILSPISDKSSQEPISEMSDNNRNNNSQKCSPEVMEASTSTTEVKIKRRLPQNKNLISLGLVDRPEIQGSDSGISIQSREGIKPRFGTTSAEVSAAGVCHPDLSDLPFDMPKLRRRHAAGIPLGVDVGTEGPCTSGSATSVDLRDLPFDMPKLRRRLRLQTAPSLEASPSHASSSQSVGEAAERQGLCRPKLTLNFGEIGTRQRTGLGLTLTGIGINSSIDGSSTSQCNSGNPYISDIIDSNLPLEKQGWFHGSITRVEAENVLRALREGSFLVRNSESIKNDFSLSLKSARGFMHMRIQKSSADGSFILGQFSKPFPSIPEMIRHFSVNRLPIRGAEHMCLLQPVIAQLL